MKIGVFSTFMSPNATPQMIRDFGRRAKEIGLEVTVQTPEFMVLGGLALGTHSEVRGRNADPARHMVGPRTDDDDADWTRLEAAGVEFVERPTDYGQLRIATLKDPEGNLIQLLQPIAG